MGSAERKMNRLSAPTPGENNATNTAANATATAACVSPNARPIAASGSWAKYASKIALGDPSVIERWSAAETIPAPIGMSRVFRMDGRPLPLTVQLIMKGINARLRARLIAVASSRCFFAETAVIRLGTILPRSDVKRCSSLTFL